MTSLSVDIGQRRLSLADKLRGIQWGLVILIAAISGIGFAMLYSAANGSLQPWASRQMTRFAMAFIPMLIVAIVDIRHWFRSATGSMAWRWCWSWRSICAALSAWARSAGSISASFSYSLRRS